MNLPENRLLKIFSFARRAFRKYKFHIVLLVVLGFFTGLLEGIGINALIPLFSLILGDQSLVSDRISKLIIKTFELFQITYRPEYLVIFIAVMFVLKAAMTIILNYIKIKITTDYEEKTRSSLFSRILAADWPYLSRLKSGYLETVLMLDIPGGVDLLDKMSSAVITGTSLLIYLAVAINVSWVITAVTLVLGTFVFFVFRPMNFKIKNLAQDRVKLNKSVAHLVSENIYGIKTVKSMLIGKRVENKGRSFFSQLRKISVKIALLKNLASSLFQPISVAVIGAVFMYSYGTSRFNLASLAVIVYLIERIFIYIQQLQKSVHSLYDAVPHLMSITNFEKQAEEHREPDEGEMPFKFERALQFQNVSFSHLERSSVLAGLDFTVKKGEMVGIIGPSGVGKTTLCDLILRLFKPSEGKILLDGREISTINLRDWRNNIGYISQDIFLTNDTLANNISFYRDFDFAEIEQAARMADIYEFVAGLPQGFETVVGDRGVTLSAGQRQRIVIARVLAGKPKLLIMDEATSALDNESEAQIQEVIKKLKGQLTVFFISHRLTAIVNFDRLLVLEQGRITEQGSPQELLKNEKSYFFKVYNLKEV